MILNTAKLYTFSYLLASVWGKAWPSIWGILKCICVMQIRPSLNLPNIIAYQKWKWNSLSHVWLLVTPMAYTVRGILQAKTLQWVAFPFSRGSFQPRDQTLHCRRILYQLSHKGSPRILQWVAYPFSRGSSWPRNRTGVSCIVARFFTNWAVRESIIGYCWCAKELFQHGLNQYDFPFLFLSCL